MMASNYCFPILTLETCVTFMKEISNTLISEEDFKKPEPRRWQHFYGLIFEWMTGRQTEAIAQARVPALYDNMEYSELHEESMSIMNFTLALQKALFSAGVTDFTIRDVFDPEPKRLLKIVSGAINFIRFRDSRIEVFESKKAELEKRREDFNFAKKENLEKKKLLQARKEAHATQMLKMKQLQEENDAVSQRLQELHREREVKQRFLAELKKDLMEKTAAVDQFKVNILAAEAECEKLSQRIVQSPERVKAEQERAKNRIMGLKSTLTEHQKRMTELQRREEAMMAQLQHVQKAVRLLRDITNDCEKLAEIEKDTSCLQDSHQDLRTTSLNLSAKHDNLCQVLATRKDKLCTLDHQFDTKKAAMEEHLTQLSQLKSTLEGGMSSCESDKAQLITKKESIVDQVEQQKLKLQNQIECANSLYSEIVKQVDKLNVDVAKGLSEVRNILIHQK